MLGWGVVKSKLVQNQGICDYTKWLNAQWAVINLRNIRKKHVVKMPLFLFYFPILTQLEVVISRSFQCLMDNWWSDQWDITASCRSSAILIVADWSAIVLQGRFPWRLQASLEPILLSPNWSHYFLRAKLNLLLFTFPREVLRLWNSTIGYSDQHWIEY